jgi:hypothetical protein
MKNGTLTQEGRANINPTNNGLMAAPVVRATPVIPAAADLSSLLTTAMMYDCLVGTSIWLILNRTRRTRTAIPRLGIRGTRIRRILEGRCVTTIVLMSPQRAARRAARSAENPWHHCVGDGSKIKSLGTRRVQSVPIEIREPTRLCTERRVVAEFIVVIEGPAVSQRYPLVSVSSIVLDATTILRDSAIEIISPSADEVEIDLEAGFLREGSYVQDIILKVVEFVSEKTAPIIQAIPITDIVKHANETLNLAERFPILASAQTSSHRKRKERRRASSWRGSRSVTRTTELSRGHRGNGQNSLGTRSE